MPLRLEIIDELEADLRPVYPRSAVPRLLWPLTSCRRLWKHSQPAWIQPAWRLSSIISEAIGCQALMSSTQDFQQQQATYSKVLTS